jgi:hypothetical protein
MINYSVSDFVGILISVFLFAYLTNLLQWGLFQVLERFFERDVEHIIHHHYHYKALR